MALMAAAMVAAFREDRYRSAGIPLPKSRCRSRLKGRGKPAGSKMLIRFYKAKHGTKPASMEEARAWWAAYLADEDAAVRAREEKRKAERRARRHPLPLAA